MSTCRDVMTREPACCQPTDSLVRVAQTMKSEDVGAIPIVEGPSRQLVGMVTDRDIVVKGSRDRPLTEQTTVREVMTTDVVTCREDEEVSSAVSRMAERQVRRIPVVDRGGSADGDHRAGRCRDSGSQGQDDRRTGGSDLRAWGIATVANRRNETATKQSSSVATGRPRSVAALEMRAI